VQRRSPEQSFYRPERSKESALAGAVKPERSRKNDARSGGAERSTVDFVCFSAPAIYLTCGVGTKFCCRNLHKILKIQNFAKFTAHGTNDNVPLSFIIGK
jgi:hypothetical protein